MRRASASLSPVLDFCSKAVIWSGAVSLFEDPIPFSFVHTGAAIQYINNDGRSCELRRHRERRIAGCILQRFAQELMKNLHDHFLVAFNQWQQFRHGEVRMLLAEKGVRCHDIGTRRKS